MCVLRWYFYSQSWGGTRQGATATRLTRAAGGILIHHKIDPLFLVIPMICHLVNSVCTPDSEAMSGVSYASSSARKRRQGTANRQTASSSFQPLSDLISSITSSAEFAVAAPFAQGEPSGASPSLDTDMGRLLRLKSVRRAFKLCCDRKGESSWP